jgi:hypothetical protein
MSGRTFLRILSAIAFGAVVVATVIAQRAEVIPADVALIVLTIAICWAVWGYLSWQRQHQIQRFFRREDEQERLSVAERRGRLAAVCEMPTVPLRVVAQSPPRPRSHPLDDGVATDARMWTDLRDDTEWIRRPRRRES